MKFVPLLFLLCACGPTWHLQQSEKHKLIAIAKGAKVKTDTVYKEIPIKVEVPGFTASSSIDILSDSALIHAVMPKYDSLLIAYEMLRRRPQHNVEKEVATAKQLDALRDKVIKGFLKDSLYHIKFDSITSVDLAIIGGKPKLVSVRVKPKSILVEKRIPIAVDERIKAGYTLWQVIGAGFAGAVLASVALGIYLWTRIRRQEVEELKGRNV